MAMYVNKIVKMTQVLFYFVLFYLVCTILFSNFFIFLFFLFFCVSKLIVISRKIAIVFDFREKKTITHLFFWHTHTHTTKKHKPTHAKQLKFIVSIVNVNWIVTVVLVFSVCISFVCVFLFFVLFVCFCFFIFFWFFNVLTHFENHQTNKTT